MFVITNRKIVKGSSLNQFGKTTNAKGGKELRLFDVSKKGDTWDVKLRTDKLTKEIVKRLKRKYDLDIDINQSWYASLQVACELFDQARKEEKSILFFVHGYNNDMENVLDAALEIEKEHGVIVVPISWPANGGGMISGTAAYLSDKSDARLSAEAVNYVISKIAFFHQLLSDAAIKRANSRVVSAHLDNPEKNAQVYAQEIAESCKVRLSLLCHSMGSYVFKHTFKPSESASRKLVFDNVCLVAADTNSHDHASWVGQIDTRNRIYIVINEDDMALKASRIKPGREQKARLGHYVKNLRCDSAVYIDLTQAEHIGNEHTYFKGDALKNVLVKALFTRMFSGDIAERELPYFVQDNTYRIRQGWLKS